jgi:hypothetical protein
MQNAILTGCPGWLKKLESTAQLLSGCREINILDTTNFAEHWCEQCRCFSERRGFWFSIKFIEKIRQTTIKRVPVRG